MLVHLFASCAELLGVRDVSIPVESPTTVAALRLALRHAHPVLPANAAIAVNEAYAADHDVVSPGDDVALIPPVAGG